MISIGDDVVIHVEDEKEAVARIKDLYYDTSQDEPCRAVIHWYFKMHELPLKVKNKVGCFLSEQFEVFWPAGDGKNLRRIEDIDAETIKEKCSVTLLSSSTRSHKPFGKYFLRFGFAKNKLISDKELLNLLSGTQTSIGKRTHSKTIPRTNKGILYTSFFLIY